MNSMTKYSPNLVAMALVAMLVLAVPAVAMAQNTTGIPTGGTTTTTTTTGSQAKTANDGVCTDFLKLKNDTIDANSPKKALLTNITNYVKEVIKMASEKLFKGFTTNPNYQTAVNAAAVLMVTIYGVGFLIGVVQASFGQVLIRLVKLGIIFALISPDGWTFFSSYAVQFFNDGTDELIGGVMAIGTNSSFTAGDSPFKQLDGLAAFVLSPEMIIAIMGSVFASGPFGLMMGGLMGMAVIGLLKMLLDGLKNYAMSFIVRSLLLGVAPLFIIFILFDRTKQLFTGWLNAMINLSLQPILYFTFISFFLVMMTTSASTMLGGAELCWTEYKSNSGTPNKGSFWRFKMKGQNAPDLDAWRWNSSVTCRMSGKKDCPDFPLNIFDILSFLILVYVAQRFSGVVEQISSEISNAFINLDTHAKMELGAQNKGVADTGTMNKPTGGQTTQPDHNRQDITNPKKS